VDAPVESCGDAVENRVDDLPGVGPARKRALLRVFGTAKAVRNASVDEIAAVPGIPRALAETIRSHLDG